MQNLCSTFPPTAPLLHSTILSNFTNPNTKIQHAGYDKVSNQCLLLLFAFKGASSISLYYRGYPIKCIFIFQFVYVFFFVCGFCLFVCWHLIFHVSFINWVVQVSSVIQVINNFLFKHLELKLNYAKVMASLKAYGFKREQQRVSSIGYRSFSGEVLLHICTVSAVLNTTSPPRSDRTKETELLAPILISR